METAAKNLCDGNEPPQAALKLVDDRREHFGELKFES
jgi:hypothetical protein